MGNQKNSSKDKDSLSTTPPKKTTTRATGSRTGVKTTKSAEEKLNRSMKNLSYTSGGIGNNMSFDDTKYAKRQSSTNNDANIRKKVGGVVLDMDTIQDVTSKGVETRTRRNNVIILVLSLLLVISCVYLTITLLQYFKGKREPACFYHIKGDVEAEWVIEGTNTTELVIPEDLKADTKYIVNSSIKINTNDAVLLTLTISVKHKDQEIYFKGLLATNNKLIQSETDRNTYIYNEQIVGGGEIYLFGGIDFNDAPAKINANNIEINITASLTKV